MLIVEKRENAVIQRVEGKIHHDNQVIREKINFSVPVILDCFFLKQAYPYEFTQRTY